MLSGWHIGEPAWLWGLWALPVLGVLAAWALARRRRALRVFAGAGAAGLVRSLGRGAALRAGLVLGALGLTVLALARPQRDPREEEITLRGRDIVFLVDVSRSMLAQDVAPSRLERAKLWINDLASGLKGDRVGLVAFAGASVVKCPLTLDYGFFRMSLEELNPGSVPRGGTLIGDAIRKTLAEVFDQTEGRFRDIVLITDGEDHESFPVQAAEQAAKQNVRIIAIGIGSETAGALVPAGEGKGGDFVEYGGSRVRSAMQAGTLEQIARASAGGVFLNVGTGTIDLEQVYHDLIETAEKSELGTRTVVRYQEKFQWFVGAALALLVAETVVGATRRGV